MMLVRTYVSRSSIHGIGLFASEPIAKGAEVWRYHPQFDIVIPRHYAALLPAATEEFLKTYAYPSELVGGNLLLDADNGRFMNHSPTPNTSNTGWVSYASRDIDADEEITCDYAEFYQGEFHLVA
ncbi:MAG: SET domain-containing protein-lysine N-methyltransferase [Alphaproteobacteria bacterium]